MNFLYEFYSQGVRTFLTNLEITLQSGHVIIVYIIMLAAININILNNFMISGHPKGKCVSLTRIITEKKCLFMQVTSILVHQRVYVFYILID